MGRQTDRPGQMHPAVFGSFAVNGDQGIGVGSQALVLPSQERGFDLKGRDTLKHT